MPIAAKLFYFQRRRPSPVDPTDDSLRADSPATARRQVHPSRSAHHRPGYEVTRGSQRDCGASSKSITEPTRDMLFSSRLSINTSNNDRLPDAVQQAKERLHQRLRSADLFPGRRQTAPAVAIWAGPNPSSECDIFASEDGRLDGRTIRLNFSASLSIHKVKNVTAEPCSGVAGVAPRRRPVSKLGQETLQVTIEGDSVESSVDCSICLEGCHSAAGGLVQLQCKHIFHSACLEQWLQSRADCPYCRASVILPLKE
uniref:Uncharacterized protein n=1 Tax=Avena sativa TaxID=4498 RepID=A0ACD5X4P2_AVESA